ncbi:MAG: cupin domain-containing protein [Verrucomicrobiota bacterium]|nr:cupin domain-containing protein [Verrucomicrobiota bacterium]
MYDVPLPERDGYTRDDVDTPSDPETKPRRWNPKGILSFTCLLRIARSASNPGQSNPRHYHPNCMEVLTVFQGSILHTMANDTKAEMHEGDTVTIPANVWHNATNIGDKEAILFIVFSSANRQTVGE